VAGLRDVLRPADWPARPTCSGRDFLLILGPCFLLNLSGSCELARAPSTCAAARNLAGRSAGASVECSGRCSVRIIAAVRLRECNGSPVYLRGDNPPAAVAGLQRSKYTRPSSEWERNARLFWRNTAFLMSLDEVPQ
jgi:hypothetical protein